MPISVIEICFIAHLNTMAEALFFNRLWTVLAFTSANHLILMTSFLHGRAYIARSWCNDVIQTFPNNRRIVPNALWRFLHAGNGLERTKVSRVLSKCREVQLNSVKNSLRCVFNKYLSNCTSVGTYVHLCMKSILSSSFKWNLYYLFYSNLSLHQLSAVLSERLAS